MKPLKMLGLGVIMALLAMALGGVPSAMAGEVGTDLCLEDEIPCEGENFVSHVHEATPEGKKAAFLSSLGTVECNVLFLGEVLEEATEGRLFLHGSFSYTSCLRKGSACEVKEVSEGSSFSMLKTSHETASMTGEEGGEVNVKCGAFINCTYSLSLKGTFKGSLLSTLKNGELSIIEQPVKSSTGSLCPKENTLDITTTPLVETFVSQGSWYCVRYENSRGRWLLGDNQTTCLKNDGLRGQNYEFIWLRDPNLTTGSMVCIRDNDNGLYYAARNGTLCENKFPLQPEGEYELGEVA